MKRLPVARRLAMFALGVLVSFAGSGLAAPAAQAQPGGLRSVDWVAVLAAEPGIAVSSDCAAALPSLAVMGPCIEVTLDPPRAVEGTGGGREHSFGGVALLSPESGGPLYGDIDGDGIEEAIIQTQSGGTGGSFGFLVYAQGEARPRLVAAVPGYKTFVAIEDGLLIVQLPYYFGFEGNCCPTGFSKTWYTIDSGALSEVGRTYTVLTGTDGGLTVGLDELVVHGFYRALSQQAYEDAWRFISPSARQGRSFEQWRDGYATTRRIAVTTAPGPGFQEVLVELEAEDETADGGTVVRRFTGSWFLVPDSSVPWGLVLDRAEIRER